MQESSLSQINKPESKETNLFKQLFSQRYQIGSKPIKIEGIKSTYGLPVMIGLRYLDYKSGPDIKRGYVFGLFEDRTGITHASLNLPNTSSTPTSIEAVEPMGWFVLDSSPIHPNGLTSHTSLLIGSGSYIGSTPLGEDQYFASFGKMASADALSIGFKKIMAEARNAVVQKLPSEERKDLKIYLGNFYGEGSKLSSYPPRFAERMHTRRGLGTILLSNALLLSQELDYSHIYFEACSDEAKLLIEKFAKNRELSLSTYEKPNVTAVNYDLAF